MTDPTARPVRRPRRRLRRHPRLYGALWLVASLLLLAAGITYFALPRASLPVFLPGHEAHRHLHLLPGAVFCLAGSMLCLVAAAMRATSVPVADQPLVTRPLLLTEAQQRELREGPRR